MTADGYRYEVLDDVGVLVLANPQALRPLPEGTSWTPEHRLAHWRDQAAEHALTLWGTGVGEGITGEYDGFLNVAVRMGHTDTEGQRSCTTYLNARGGMLCVCSIYDLKHATAPDTPGSRRAMQAALELALGGSTSDREVTPPLVHNMVAVPPGIVAVRIVQLWDPASQTLSRRPDTDFLLEMTNVDAAPPVPAAPFPWLDDDTLRQI